MFNRRLVTNLPSHTDPSPSHVDTRDHLVNRLAETTGPELQPLYAGQPIRIRDEVMKMWQEGSVIRRLDDPRSYLVATKSGSQLRRNRQQLRTVPLKPPTGLHQGAQPCAATPPVIRTLPVPDKVQEHTQEPGMTKLPTAESTPKAAGGDSTSPKCTRSGRQVRPPQRFHDQ